LLSSQDSETQHFGTHSLNSPADVVRIRPAKNAPSTAKYFRGQSYPQRSALTGEYLAENPNTRGYRERWQRFMAKTRWISKWGAPARKPACRYSAGCLTEWQSGKTQGSPHGRPDGWPIWFGRVLISGAASGLGWWWYGAR